MPSFFRTSKNLPEWIELDYYQRPRGLRRWRRFFTWTTLLLCAGGIAIAALLPRASRVIQAAPISSAHGMFNDHCERCHQEPFSGASKFLPGNADRPLVKDDACVQCHDGPEHVLLASEKIACANCHREHRGRQALARVADGQCTACHADLGKHREGGAAEPEISHIRSFTDGHPEVGLDRRKDIDKGTLRFNHKVHLKSEGIRGPDRQLVRLDCVRCHKPESTGRFGLEDPAPRPGAFPAGHEPDSSGRFMQPVKYEKHCAECHPLSVQLVGAFQAGDQKQTEAVRQFNGKPALHGEPAAVRADLRERLLTFAQQFPVVLGEPEGKLVDSKLLGRRGTRPPSDGEWKWTLKGLAELQQRLFFTERQLVNTEQVLFQNGGGCLFCHTAKPREPDRPEASDLPQYQKVNFRNGDRRWMPKARFHHTRHRMLNCTECHKATESTKTSDLLMPSIGTCQKCHNSRVGIRHDCAECHVYHNWELKHDVHKTRTIEELLGR